MSSEIELPRIESDDDDNLITNTTTTTNNPNVMAYYAPPTAQERIINAISRVTKNKHVQECWNHFININRWLYYFQHAKREMFSRKFNFCIGCCSVFIVVLVTAVSFTMIANMPAVFLQQGETKAGQIDLSLQAETSVTNQKFINYTAASINAEIHDEFQYHTARKSWQISNVFTQACNKRLEEFSTHMGPKGVDEISWRYLGIPSLGIAYTCANSTQCISKLCNEGTIEGDDISGANRRGTLLPNLHLIHSKREKRMGLGRAWSYDTIPRGSALIEQSVAKAYDFNVGDRVWLTYSMREELESMGTDTIMRLNNNTMNDAFSRQVTLFPTAVFYVTVADIVDSFKGKFSNDDVNSNVILMEFDDFWPFIADQLHPDLTNMSVVLNTTTTTGRAILTQSNLYEFANEVIVNIPPPRTEAYMNSNYDKVQTRVVGFVSRALYFMGFSETDGHMHLLNELRLLRFFTLYLGLILSIVLTILCILAIMLIYSLLLISIESRTFELGIHRMVGMKRIGIVELLSIQAFSYSIPAWSLGLIISQWIATSLLTQMEKSVEVPIKKTLTPNAIWLATFLGLVIPLVASVFPIRKALGLNLFTSLDTRHSKTLAVKTSIERSEDERFAKTLFAFGLGLVVFGFLIYYLLPLSLLSFNLALFFNIFFAILLGMLFGLILLAMNIQFLIEKSMVMILLWWERRPIRAMVDKNLAAHRLRNRKTAMMYALALGFIIFITVSFLVELKTAESRQLLTQGAPLRLESGNTLGFKRSELKILETMLDRSHICLDFAYETVGLADARASMTDSESFDYYCTNRGHVEEGVANIVGVSPNYYDVLLRSYLRISGLDLSSGLVLSRQLYTIRGSQAMIVPSGFSDHYDIHDISVDSSVLLVPDYHPIDTTIDIHQIRPLAYLDQSPALSMSRFKTERTQDVAVSFQTYLRLSNGTIDSLDDIPLRYLYIKLTDSASDKEIDDLIELIQNADVDAGVNDIRDLQETLRQTRATMILIFGVAMLIAILLCVFSLMASMYTNIFEQSKEIAILRAIGMTRSHIVLIYVYEAFVLVCAASFLGICIGILMGWSMLLQRVLFTQLPVSIDFPIEFIIITVVAAALCGVISSYAPARVLVKKSIAQIMRTLV